MDTCRVLIIDCSTCSASGTEGGVASGRGGKLWSLASESSGVSASFVLRTADLLAGISCPADYEDKPVPATRNTESIPRSAIAEAITPHDLILYHISNQDPADFESDLRKIRTKHAIPMIEFTGGPVNMDVSIQEWKMFPTIVRISAMRLSRILPHFLSSFISAQGDRQERFKRSVERVIFAETQAMDLLAALMPLDVLVQGALTMMGMRREDRDPWWWSDSEAARPQVVVDSEPLEASLREYERDPQVWFGESVEALQGLFPAGRSHQGLLDVLALLDKNSAFAIECRLLPCDESGDLGEGSLVRLAKAVVRIAAEGATADGRDRDLLTSAETLKKAHEEYSGMCKELCS